jgi:TolB-like protein/DNA-binding winged helix-turn-helix (wHTH) protein/Tfp pilus assembly protein PilF
MKGNTHRGFRLGNWQVYPLRNLLVGPPGEVHIEPKVMQVLNCLASKPGEVFERGKLLEDLWDGRALSDEPLTRCIAALRHALGDSPTRPEYIQTIPKVGYRLICPVEALGPATDDADAGESAVSRKKGVSGSGRPIALAVFLGLILIAVVYVASRSMLTGPGESPPLSVEDATRSEAPVYSIAILPFRNRSNLAEDAFFVDGIHDDILMQLAKFSSLDKVISRTSVERYRDTSKPMPQIGRELGVATVLEGSVQRAGERVRINVQFIDAATDNHLWGESYDRELTAENLFAVQSEISREIVGALQLVLTDEENKRLEAMPTVSLEAYNEYAEGRQEMARRTAEALYRAQAHFEKAIELDSDYALAYIGLADTLALQVVPHTNLRMEDSFAPRQAAIDRALALDPFLGEAYTSLASLRLDQSSDQEAVEYFLKGIELSPNYATAYERYGSALIYKGRTDSDNEAALPYLRKAIELDPMSAVTTESLGHVLFRLGRVEEAQTTLLKGIERNPGYPRFYTRMSQQLSTLGRVGEAAQWVRAATRLAPSDFGIRHRECKLYLELGAYQSAEHCYDSAQEAFSERGGYSRKLMLYLSRSQPREAEAVELVDQLAQRALNPSVGDGRPAKELLAWSHFQLGEMAKARLILQELEPDLYGDEDVFNKVHDENAFKKGYGGWTMARVAYTLYADGQLDRANYLFDGMLEAMQSLHRTRGRAYGVMDVFIHATRGDRQKAISALREAIDMGWRVGWWELRSMPYDLMREDPEWIDLINELEADIARQRQWFENHKDDPLF